MLFIQHFFLSTGNLQFCILGHEINDFQDMAQRFIYFYKYTFLKWLLGGNF